MRPVIKACLVALGLILPTSVQAACEDPSFGHSRTIKLHPKDHGTLLGHEKKLGLAHKEVVLTFDDGPLPEYTSKVLDALEAHCAKATFFVVGRMAKAYPATLKKVARFGHTIAHHTHRHDRLTNFSVAG